MGPYLLRPSDAALFIPSIASLGGARSGSPRPRLIEFGPARSNIFLIPDIGMSFILLEICMFAGHAFYNKINGGCGVVFSVCSKLEIRIHFIYGVLPDQKGFGDELVILTEFQ